MMHTAISTTSPRFSGLKEVLQILKENPDNATILQKLPELAAREAAETKSLNPVLKFLSRCLYGPAMDTSVGKERQDYEEALFSRLRHNKVSEEELRQLGNNGYVPKNSILKKAVLDAKA